jgi:hypothetical protein
VQVVGDGTHPINTAAPPPPPPAGFEFCPAPPPPPPPTTTAKTCVTDAGIVIEPLEVIVWRKVNPEGIAVGSVVGADAVLG